MEPSNYLAGEKPDILTAVISAAIIRRTCRQLDLQSGADICAGNCGAPATKDAGAGEMCRSRC